jgi:hypothetical protein
MKGRLPEGIFVGYFPKRTVTRPEWLEKVYRQRRKPEQEF